jgi:hypothetical protein
MADKEAVKPEDKKHKQTTIKDLELRIENLTSCVAKMAHFSGNQRIMDEFKIPRWEPGKKDMSKYSQES